MASKTGASLVADCINKVLNTYKEIDDSVEMQSITIEIFTRMLVECLCSKYSQEINDAVKSGHGIFSEDKFKNAVYKDVWEELISDFEGTIWIQ